MTYDLTIALRVSPILSQKHPYFTSKYDLVDRCFASLTKSLQGLSYELIVILDNCREYEGIFREQVNSKDLRVLYAKGIGNVNTFLYQIHLLLTQAKAEHVYFAEDDYYYVGKMNDIFEFISDAKNAADFATPYDHPDYYGKLHTYRKAVKTCKNRKWKQVASTTMTFLTSRKILKETERIFKLYPRLWDHLTWSLLTRKTPLWRLVHPTYGFLDYKLRFFAPYAIRTYPRYRKYSLWAPEPAIATHLDINGLLPDIDWREQLGFSENRNRQKDIVSS